MAPLQVGPVTWSSPSCFLLVQSASYIAKAVTSLLKSDKKIFATVPVKNKAVVDAKVT